MTRTASIALLAFVALTSGCNYHMGTEAAPPFSTITIDAVKNDSFAPQMQAEIHRQIADSLAQEAVLHVVPSGGRGRLAVTITDYRREVAAVNPADTVTAASYSMTLDAKVTLTDAASGKVLFRDRPFRAMLPAYAQAGFNRTESQTLPLLSRELAKNIKDAVVGVW
jgi:outer membrane lipopolysaccharide assembly protein LptE/RlpB